MIDTSTHVIVTYLHDEKNIDNGGKNLDNSPHVKSTWWQSSHWIIKIKFSHYHHACGFSRILAWFPMTLTILDDDKSSPGLISEVCNALYHCCTSGHHKYDTLVSSAGYVDTASVGRSVQKLAAIM